MKTPPPPLQIAGTEVRPGHRAQLEIPIARLPHGASASLPCMVIHGARPGPRVWVDAAVHGDELTGIEVVRRLIRQVGARSLAGALLLVPMTNVFGVAGGSRYLPDRRDLNRSFPGGPSGSLAGRLAHTLLTEIVAHCEAGVDVHSGSDNRENLPQIRADLSDERTRSLALAFGAPIVIDARERAGSLRGEASALGKTVLLYEGGEPLRFNEHAVEVGVHGVLRLLRHLGMLRGENPSLPQPRISSRTRWTRASRGGLFRAEAELGAIVANHDSVGVVCDPFGRLINRVRARCDGVVIGLQRNPVVFQGDAVVHVAEVADPPDPTPEPGPDRGQQ